MWDLSQLQVDLAEDEFFETKLAEHHEVLNEETEFGEEQQVLAEVEEVEPEDDIWDKNEKTSWLSFS